MNILLIVFLPHNYRVHLFFFYLLLVLHIIYITFSLQIFATKTEIPITKNEFAYVCKSTENLLGVFESMKHQIVVLKAAIAGRRDLEIDTNIRDTTLKLDKIFVKIGVAYRAFRFACERQQSAVVAKGE